MAKPRELTDDLKKQVLDFVLEEIALSSISLRKATHNAMGFFKLDSLKHNTVLKWINDFDYHDQYAGARETRAENIFEEIIDIVDCEDHDMGIDDNGNPRVNHDVIQRDRLRVDARKWMLGKMQPKKYGDKLDVTTDGEKIDGGVTIFQLPDNGRG